MKTRRRERREENRKKRRQKYGCKPNQTDHKIRLLWPESSCWRLRQQIASFSLPVVMISGGAALRVVGLLLGVMIGVCLHSQMSGTSGETVVAVPEVQEEAPVSAEAEDSRRSLMGDAVSYVLIGTVVSVLKLMDTVLLRLNRLCCVCVCWVCWVDLLPTSCSSPKKPVQWVYGLCVCVSTCVLCLVPVPSPSFLLPTHLHFLLTSNLTSSRSIPMLHVLPCQISRH